MLAATINIYREAEEEAAELRLRLLPYKVYLNFNNNGK